MNGSTRVEEEYLAIATALRDHPHVALLAVSGQPPERYTIEYRVRGLAPSLDTARQGPVAPRDIHHVEFFLPPDFPRKAPRVRVVTPVFHPNIDGALTTLGDDWDGASRVVDVIFRVGRALAYQEFELENPLNEEAKLWVMANRDAVPTDDANLIVPSPGSAAPMPVPPAAPAAPAPPAPPTLPTPRKTAPPTARTAPARVAAPKAPPGSNQGTPGEEETVPVPPRESTDKLPSAPVVPSLAAARLVDVATSAIHEITGNVSTIGRGVRNKIILPDKGVSRVHCRIERAPTGFRIVDIASTNGTFVNQKRISSITLHSGDEIRLGTLVLRFEER